MENIEIDNSIHYWDQVHQNYKREDIIYDDWLEDFKDLIMSCETPILDLGCGSGNNTLYLIQNNKKVIACDLSSNAITNIQKNFPEIVDAKCLNILDGLPFLDSTFEIIIADLSLHYFTKNDTEKVLKELLRILKDNGHILIRVNSIHDINHGAGQGMEVEHHLYKTEDGRLKRFFDEEDVKTIFHEFEIEYMKEEIMTRYKLEKKLYRICLKKK